MHGSFQVFSSKDKLHCRLNILNFEYLAIYSVTVSWVLARSFKNMSPKTIDDIYADYKGRRTGIIRALAEGEARYPPRWLIVTAFSCSRKKEEICMLHQI